MLGIVVSRYHLTQTSPKNPRRLVLTPCLLTKGRQRCKLICQVSTTPEYQSPVLNLKKKKKKRIYAKALGSPRSGEAPQVSLAPRLAGFMVLEHYSGILCPDLVIISASSSQVEIQNLFLRTFQSLSGTSKQINPFVKYSPAALID